MFHKNDEFTGKPNLYQKIARIVVQCGFISLFLWLAMRYHTEFSSYEAGNSIRLDAFSILVYKLGGKWLNIGLCIALSLLFAFLGVRQVREDWREWD